METSYILTNLSWIVGSTGTLVFDFIVSLFHLFICVSYLTFFFNRFLSNFSFMKNLNSFNFFNNTQKRFCYFQNRPPFVCVFFVHLKAHLILR